MSLILNTNVSSLLAQQRLSSNIKTYQKSLQRLATGQRINSAADDAAGLTISKNMEGQILRMKQASRNVQDGVSILQIAEGALAVVSDNLQRIRELTVQAANDTNNTASRDAIESEIKALLNDVDRIANSTRFNGIPLLDGSQYTRFVQSGVAARLQIGPDSDTPTNTLDLSPIMTTSTSAGLQIVGTGSSTFASINAINFSNSTDAMDFLSDVDLAIRNVVNKRASIGAFQNQLESATANLDFAIENFSASNSRIRDLDVAEESATMVQYQILQEASATVLAQTNRLPQMILSILKG